VKSAIRDSTMLSIRHGRNLLHVSGKWRLILICQNEARPVFSIALNFNMKRRMAKDSHIPGRRMRRRDFCGFARVGLTRCV
jgi:hypothetical protein